MRHGDKINNLSRTRSHRKALLANLACQLIEHKRINTTLAKAKALRVYIEPLVTKSKKDNTHNRRIVFSKLHDKHAVTELFGPVSVKVADRPGGYTRIIKLQPRLGDAADMAMIEFVDFNTLYSKDGAEEKKKTRRSRRGGKSNKPAANKDKAATEDTAAAPAAEKAKETKETPKVEEPEAPAPKVKEPKEAAKPADKEATESKPSESDKTAASAAKKEKTDDKTSKDDK